MFLRFCILISTLFAIWACLMIPLKQYIDNKYGFSFYIFNSPFPYDSLVTNISLFLLLLFFVINLIFLPLFILGMSILKFHKSTNSILLILSYLGLGILIQRDITMANKSFEILGIQTAVFMTVFSFIGYALLKMNDFNKTESLLVMSVNTGCFILLYYTTAFRWTL